MPNEPIPKGIPLPGEHGAVVPDPLHGIVPASIEKSHTTRGGFMKSRGGEVDASVIVAEADARDLDIKRTEAEDAAVNATVSNMLNKAKARRNGK